MRILVVSDTHGDLRSLIKAVDAQRKAEIIVHCGDGEEQQRFLKDNYKDKMIVAVRGNCDWNSFFPSKEIFKACGKTIFVTNRDFTALPPPQEKQERIFSSLVIHICLSHSMRTVCIL